MRLRTIRNGSRGPARLRWDDGREFTVPRRVLSELDLEAGNDYDPTTVEQRIQKTSRRVLGDRARQYLARYQKTAHEYHQHFQAKGYDRELLESLLPDLKQEGFLDDESTAREHVRKRLRSKSYGRRKLLAELQEKGIDRGRAREILDDLYPSDREEEIARDYCQDHTDLPPRKLASRLNSRGFPSYLIGDLVDEYAAD